MKILTLLGTRPEIIRLCRILPKLDEMCQHTLVHTGQNFDTNLSDIFFEQLELRQPDHYLNAQGVFGQQIGIILTKVAELIDQIRPDRFLILGDTNSALAAIAVKRAGIPVYHMEAGNRCFDDRVPEEVNRRIIDHCSDILMPYTERSRDHLLREGIPANHIYVTGNPIREVMDFYEPRIAGSDVLKRLNVGAGGYFLVTLHRAENVDLPDRLQNFMGAFTAIHARYGLPVLLSLHPRTRSRLDAAGSGVPEGVHFFDPPGFFDFVHLERHAKALLSDSGTVQEEGCLLGVPTVTLRDVTERPETLECGSNILTGGDKADILRCLEVVLRRKGKWTAPAEYLEENVSDTVCNIALGYTR